MLSFPIVMRGYDRRQVDELFARIDGTLGRGPATPYRVTATDIRATRFAVRLRGYAPKEVDEALATAVHELERQSG